MANGKTWFRAQALRAHGSVKRGEVQIFSDIGAWGVTALDFSDALKRLQLGAGDDLDVRISSDGGDVSTGFAIYNMLSRHPANKTVTVEGLAASMGSVVAMAGDVVVMPSNSMLMIHNPWGGAVGQSDEIISFGEALGNMQVQIVAAYTRRTGMSAEATQVLMDKESWLTAEKAVELGFADSVEEPLAIAAKFDTHRFTKVPKAFAARYSKESTMTKTAQNARAAKTDDESGADDPNALKTMAEIRADILAQQAEVRSLCKLAGKPELAEGFIAKDTAPADVLKELSKAKEGKAKEGGELNGHKANGDRGTGEQVAAEINPQAIYEKYNRVGKK